MESSGYRPRKLAGFHGDIQFGRMVQRARRTEGLSQEQLCERLRTLTSGSTKKWSQRYISQLETGTRRLLAADVYTLARALNFEGAGIDLDNRLHRISPKAWYKPTPPTHTDKDSD
ncbi:helix-turn-helix DNA binding protein [Corynebacterium phage EmiRose]|uniref:Helix-turn-helix DNA binding protein n=1 Tax=Corynebacterium phage EmiRose TaxID=2565372 RepID=A0A649VNX8_9CAUD|nr:helix-turn-helix DNA binding protein [Corynebacterium phage EmiRose]QGJ94167.1 helix-turn-helix DNA binding protein [Corynebacterium phage EmiRose]